MSVWSAALIVAMVGLITYSMRAVAIVALANRTIPPAAGRALRYVGPAVLAALTFNLAAGGEGGPSMEPAQALALLVAGGVAWWRKNLILTLGAGMLTLWVASALI
jgi:branched-subunit amino acid transport protein